MSLFLFIVLVSGCSSKLEVTIPESVTLEYGTELKYEELFVAASSDEDVKVSSVTGFDAKKCGEQQVNVVYTNEKGNKEVEATVKVVVNDTQKPMISLAKEKITVECGDKLNLKDLVKEVKDPVDGTLNYSDKKIDSYGWFFDKGDLDLKKAGTYEVKVISVDLNKNTSEEKITVTVKEKEIAKVVEPVIDQVQTYQEEVIQQPTYVDQTVQSPVVEQPIVNEPPKKNDKDNSSNEKVEQDKKKDEVVVPIEEEDDEPVIIRELGNSGMVGSREEMKEWANAQLLDSNSKWWKEGYRGWESWNVDQWGELWTVNFYKKNNK